MGWLIGLPLGILMVLVRLAVPILVIAVVIYLWRRSRRGGTSSSKEPDFDGPVYTVDYEEVDDDGEDGHGAC